MAVGLMREESLLDDLLDHVGVQTTYYAFLCGQPGELADSHGADVDQDCSRRINDRDCG